MTPIGEFFPRTPQDDHVRDVFSVLPNPNGALDKPWIPVFQQTLGWTDKETWQQLHDRKLWHHWNTLDPDDHDVLPETHEETSVLSAIPRNVRVNLADFFAPEEVVAGSEIFENVSVLTTEGNDLMTERKPPSEVRQPRSREL